MVLPPGTDGRLLGCLLLLFLCRALVAGAVVPPWQGPDEPTHVAASRWLAVPKRAADAAPLRMLPDGTFIDATRQEIFRDVLASMARHGWWESRSVPTPEPVPTAFHEVERGRLLPIGSYGQPLYYGLAAVVLRVIPPEDIEATYLRLRCLSVALATAALVFGWAGTRLLFGSAVAAGATAIGVLHPQFLLMAIAANPDALAALCGAAAWWLVASIICGRRRTTSFILLLAAIGAAPLIKRSAMSLVVVGGVLGVALLAANLIKSRRGRIAAVLLSAAVAIAIVQAPSFISTQGELRRLAVIWQSAFLERRPEDRATVLAAIEYLRTSVDYSWLVAGWVRFRPSEPWLWVARAMTVAAIVGAAVTTVRASRVRWRLAVAWAFVAISFGAVVVTGFVRLAAPEGRHWFTAFAPLTVLMFVGLTSIIPARWRRYTVAVVLGLMALLDVTGLATVVMSAYVPSILRVL